MKAKCPVCTKTKGRRNCLLKANARICSLCCASIRKDETCSDCPHFSDIQQYEHEKMFKKGAHHFIAEINPEIEEIVDNALILIDNNDHTSAEKIIVPLLKQHPRNHSLHYAMGCIFAVSDQQEEAIIHFRKAVEIFPYFMEAWHNLGISYRKIRNAYHAITCARKVIELGDPDEVHVQDSQHFITVAKTHFAKRGLTLDVYLTNSKLYKESFTHLENGNIEKARTGFNKILLTEKDHIRSYCSLALCHAMLGNKQTALEHIDKALQIDPDYEAAISNRPIIEALKDGEKLKTSIRVIDFYSSGMEAV